MNVADEASRSCWMEAMPQIAAPPLTGQASCDLVVIGSGIAGLSSAYEAARLGQVVIVIDRGRICGGMTARTTAHLDDAVRAGVIAWSDVPAAVSTPRWAGA